jgi:hypothetical protein
MLLETIDFLSSQIKLSEHDLSLRYKASSIMVMFSLFWKGAEGTNGWKVPGVSSDHVLASLDPKEDFLMRVREKIMGH